MEVLLYGWNQGLNLLLQDSDEVCSTPVLYDCRTHTCVLLINSMVLVQRHQKDPQKLIQYHNPLDKYGGQIVNSWRTRITKLEGFQSLAASVARGLNRTTNMTIAI